MELSIREIQQAILNIIKEIHTVAADNNIKYYACGGTLLGAVRYKGFIPWDDDLDICVPRKDYDRFLELIQTKTSENITVKDGCINYDIAARFGKIYDTNTETISLITKEKFAKGHLFVDVFPLDGFPDDEQEAQALIKKRNIYCKLNNAYYANPEIYSGAKKLASKLVPVFFRPDFFAKKLNNLHKKYEFGNTKMCCIGVYTWDKLEIYKTKFFKEAELYDFEDFKIYGTRDAREMLTDVFGDYMTLPPEDKRTSTHQMVAYYKK